MIIDRNQYYTMITSDEKKLLVDIEKNICKVVYLPLTLTDDEIKERYKQVDESDFQIQVPHGKYTKLQIRRACRELGIESKLNDLLKSNEIFFADWSDAQEIDLTDTTFLLALSAGQFTELQIQNIKEHIKHG